MIVAHGNLFHSIARDRLYGFPNHSKRLPVHGRGCPAGRRDSNCAAVARAGICASSGQSAPRPSHGNSGVAGLAQRRSLAGLEGLSGIVPMSRGLGWLQQKVLSILEAEDRLWSALDIAGEVYDVKPGQLISAAQDVAVRRALKRLPDDKVAGIRGFSDGRNRWGNARYVQAYLADPPKGYLGRLSSRTLAAMFSRHHQRGFSASTLLRVRRRQRAS
jgi:hypothetical protein